MIVDFHDGFSSASHIRCYRFLSKIIQVMIQTYIILFTLDYLFIRLISFISHLLD